MNRNEEYMSLMKELEESVPDLRVSVQRARSRRNRVTLLYRPLTALAACFVLFVMLVNFSVPVAQAIYEVPILGELARAVTFSRSLSDAVQHDYVQQMDLVQENNGVTAKIEYVIVDRKQVNVFYRLTSEEYTAMYTIPQVLTSDGAEQEPCTWTTPINDVPNEEIRLITLDYVEEEVPGSLQLVLYAYDVNGVSPESERPVAKFTFLLEFDPERIAEAIVYSINQTIVMDGRKITVAEIEVYPTHLRVNVESDAANTAWLKTLDFYIETEDGRFDVPAGGIIATGSAENKSEMSFRADSIYFYEAEQIRLVITGARWLQKDRESIRIDLITGEADALPEGVTLVPAGSEKSVSPVMLHVQCDQNMDHHIFLSMMYYDARGSLCQASVCFRQCAEHDGYCWYEWLDLKDYPYDHIWIRPTYSRIWSPEKPVVINVR